MAQVEGGQAMSKLSQPKRKKRKCANCQRLKREVRRLNAKLKEWQHDWEDALKMGLAMGVIQKGPQP